MAEHEKAMRPEDITRLFVERSNAGDAASVAALYEPGAVLAYPPGSQTVGRAAIQALWERVLAGRPRFEPGEPPPTLVSGDVALTSTPPREGAGARAQVVRRQPDGRWLRVLDQPEFVPATAAPRRRRPNDEHGPLQRYSRRREGSPWSAVNVAKAEALIAAGRMRPPGLAEIDAARADGRWDAAYAAQRDVSVPPDLAAAARRRRPLRGPRQVRPLPADPAAAQGPHPGRAQGPPRPRDHRPARHLTPAAPWRSPGP